MVNKVQIPKGLLVGLVGVAAAAVLGMAFLLGRESARTSQGAPRKASVGSIFQAAPTVPAASAKTHQASDSPPGLEVPGSAPVSGAGSAVVSDIQRSLPPSAGPPAIAILPKDSGRTAVAAYFQAVDSIQQASNGDPEAMAQQIVAGLGKGDSSGFDGMSREAREARGRLAAIAPPESCAAYHHACLESLDAGLDLMLDMKKALSSSEQETSMLNLTDRANALKARSEALQLQERALKQRYGLLK